MRKEEKDRQEKALIDDVLNDYAERRAARKALERQWELNMNFLSGNQYVKLNARGDITDDDGGFFWERKESFNHIAPIIETRVAKLARIRPTVYVRPKSDDDKDVSAANVAEKLIESAFNKTRFDETVKKATLWSETCGTAFYKIVWNAENGETVAVVDGTTIKDGDVEIIPVSPFEIFPDNLCNEDINDCKSLIHARAVNVSEIKRLYGVEVAAENVNTVSRFSKEGIGTAEKPVGDLAVLIERYEAPSEEFPDGRLAIVGGGKLLYCGELPYVNGESGKRGFPFVKQEACVSAGNFFGNSLIERLIPVQRAYNAVKNRKHEFLNRLSMGVLTVEDGAVDVDDLSEDGLSPGKVIVYRQGSKPPEMMGMFSIPTEFGEEEEKLINEFVIISGVSDVSSSKNNAKLSSGSALEILIEQDNERLTLAAETVRRCYLKIAKQIIRLYAQFFGGTRAVKTVDACRRTRIVYADKNSVASDDAYIENENELLYSEKQKKELVFKLYSSGLLADDDGKLQASTREKLLALLGHKDLDVKKGIARLQEERAQKENVKLRRGEAEIAEIDDDALHISEHTRYFLSEYDELDKTTAERFNEHIRKHKQRINEKGE